MKINFLLLLLAGFTFTACTNNSPSVKPSTTLNKYENASTNKAAAYNKDMRSVGLSTRKDSKYKSFGFKTSEEKIWFRNLTYSYWHRDITKNQFVEQGLTKYPKHGYELNFVADGFQKV